ncbi:MAG: pimeloyl-ACP methyl ester esterase BioH [Aestuariibacter sp.]
MKLKVQDLASSPNCVLLHGWGVNSGVFRHICAKMPSYLRIRLIDLPGFGGNNHVNIQAIDFADLCKELLPAIPKNSVVIGWSLGGLFAQQLALVAPTKVRATIQVCSSPKFVADEQWFGIKPTILEQFKAQLSEDHAKTVDRFLAIQAMGSVTAKKDIKEIRELVANAGAPHPEALAQGLQFLHSVDLRTELKHSTVPTLRIYGGKDSLVPVKGIDAVRELCPNSEQAVIAAASHAPFISHPEDFVAELDKYLSRIAFDIP